MFRFPRTNFHELNLDWILNKIKDLDKKVQHLIDTGGGGAEPYDGTPANLGTAAPGTSNQFARGDHVHALPGYGDFIIPIVTDNSSGAVTKTLDSDKIYNFTSAEITSIDLTLDNTGNNHFHFIFISGDTAATISIVGVSWVNGFFTPAANTKYEVDILNGMGVYAAWPT